MLFFCAVCIFLREFDHINTLRNNLQTCQPKCSQQKCYLLLDKILLTKAGRSASKNLLLER